MWQVRVTCNVPSPVLVRTRSKIRTEQTKANNCAGAAAQKHFEKLTTYKCCKTTGTRYISVSYDRAALGNSLTPGSMRFAKAALISQHTPKTILHVIFRYRNNNDNNNNAGSIVFLKPRDSIVYHDPGRPGQCWEILIVLARISRTVAFAIITVYTTTCVGVTCC